MTNKLLWVLLSMILVIIGSLITSCAGLSTSDTSTNSQKTSISTRGIAEVTGIDAKVPMFGLLVWLKPQNAKANTTYLVQLYEKGQFREQQTITWTQPQINVKQETSLAFHFKQGEDSVYMDASWKDSNWWKSIFSVNLEQSTPTPTPLSTPEQPSTSYSTYSDSFVMTGLAITFTPSSTGSVHLTIWGTAHMDVSGQVQACYGTGIAPSSGADAQGIFQGTKILGLMQGQVNSQARIFSILSDLPNLTVGTTYWFDLQFKAVGGGTVTLSNIGYNIGGLSGNK